MFNARRLFGFLETGKIPEMTALDAAIDAEVSRQVNLQKHDARFHGGHYDGKSSCKYREALARGDAPDANLSCSWADSPKSGDTKRRAQFRSILSKKRQDISPDAQDALLDEIEKFKTPKEQKLALHWFVRGAIKLPEDAYKVTDAVGYADRAKKDPFTYISPMSLINELHEFKPKEKPIDPDTVPELSDKKTFPMGVTTYLVEDSLYGQQAMRKIIDTHWGEKASPWCLLARDLRRERCLDLDVMQAWFDRYGKDNSIPQFNTMYDEEQFYLKHGTDGLDQAWKYWNHYNGLPKRVAFKDGKLLAFMATEKISPFDDDGYPDLESVYALADIYPDKYGEYESWLETDEGQAEDANFIEWLDHEHPALLDEDSIAEHTKEQWWDRQDKAHSGIPLGDVKVDGDPFGRWRKMEIRDSKPWHEPGYSRGEWQQPGYVSWHNNGLEADKVDMDGRKFSWHDDGSLIRYEDKVFRFEDKVGNTSIRDYSKGRTYVYSGGRITETFSHATDGKITNSSHVSYPIGSLPPDERNVFDDMVAKMNSLKAKYKQTKKEG